MPDRIREFSLTWRVMPDMLCILNDKGCFADVNPAWETCLGWKVDDLVGKPFVDFLHEDDVERSLAAFDVVRSGEPVLKFENRYLTKSGDYKWLSWVAVPESGDYYCTARDVTEDRRRVEIIREQQTEAELREQFLAVLGHDLRNPLAAFKSGARLLRKEIDSPKSAHIMDHMDQSAKRMEELILNMMDLAKVRLGSGLGVEKTQVSDLAAEITEVIEEIRLAYPGIELVEEIDISSADNSDVPRLKQVVSNLLGNAVKHGDASQPIKIVAMIKDQQLEVTVINHGEPLPEAAREDLFKPFFRGKVRNSQQGLGLGLYISSQIAHEHGGTVTAQSDTRQTAFTLSIPIV